MFIGSIFMGAAGFFFIPLTSHFGLQVLFMCLIGFSSGALQTVALVFVGEVMPKNQMATAMAFIGLFWSLSQAMLPPLLGALDTIHVAFPFAGLGLLFLVMGVWGVYLLVKYQPVKRVES